MNGATRITTVNPEGDVIGAVTGDDPFMVVVTIPEEADPLPEIEVTISGSDSETIMVTLDEASEPPTYRSGLVTIDSLGLDSSETGEIYQVFTDGAYHDIAAFTDEFSLGHAQLSQYLDTQWSGWWAFLQTLEQQQADDPAIETWKKVASNKLAIIERATVHLDNEEELPHFRLGAAAYYAQRVGSVENDSPTSIAAMAGYFDNRTSSGLIEIDRRAISRIRNDASDQAWDAILGMVGSILLSGYDQLTHATGAAAYWELVTGTDIYGEKGSRVYAAIEFAFTVALEVAGVALTRQLVKRDAAGRGQSVVGTRGDLPAVGTRLKNTGIKTGTRVHPRDAGILQGAMTQLRHTARKHGVVFVFRPANIDALKYQELGFSYKPMPIKQKTLTGLDYELGGPRTYDRMDAQGLVGYYRPTLPAKYSNQLDLPTDQQSPLVQLYVSRKAEWEDADLRKQMDFLEEEGLIRLENGLIVDTGLSDFIRHNPPGSVPSGNLSAYAGRGTGLPITGDYDLFSILKNGRELTDIEAAKILEDLQGVFVKIQHGSNRAWQAQGKYEAVKLAIEIDHTAPGSDMYRALEWQLKQKGKKVKPKGEALVVVNESGQAPVVYWHGEPLPADIVEVVFRDSPIPLYKPQLGEAGLAIRVLVLGTGGLEEETSTRTPDTSVHDAEDPGVAAGAAAVGAAVAAAALTRSAVVGAGGRFWTGSEDESEGAPGSEISDEEIEEAWAAEEARADRMAQPAYDEGSYDVETDPDMAGVGGNADDGDGGETETSRKISLPVLIGGGILAALLALFGLLQLIGGGGATISEVTGTSGDPDSGVAVNTTLASSQTVTTPAGGDGSGDVAAEDPGAGDQEESDDAVEVPLGTWTGTLAFTPLPGSQSNVAYEAMFEVGISLQGSVNVVVLTQQPSEQRTSGKFDPTGGAFYTWGGDETNYHEFYVLRVKQRGPDQIELLGVTFGGGVDLADHQDELVLQVLNSLSQDGAVLVAAGDDPLSGEPLTPEEAVEAATRMLREGVDPAELGIRWVLAVHGDLQRTDQ